MFNVMNLVCVRNVLSKYKLNSCEQVPTNYLTDTTLLHKHCLWHNFQDYPIPTVIVFFDTLIIFIVLQSC